MKKVAFLLLSVVLLTACKSAPKLKVGDVVLADWYQDNWHVAKLVAECKGEGDAAGWTVDFNDNFYDASEGSDPVCYLTDKVILNAAPSADKVKVGDTVLAEWVEDAYYTAKIDKFENDEYSVKFVSDGWESRLKLDKLRLLPEKKEEKSK